MFYILKIYPDIINQGAINQGLWKRNFDRVEGKSYLNLVHKRAYDHKNLHYVATCRHG